MKLLKQAAGNLIICFNALLLLFFFIGDRMVFPPWLQTIGRMHPLLLHIPIGVLIVTATLVVARKYFDNETLRPLITFFLFATALTASLTGLMGMVLSAEGGYNPEALALHRNLGTILSLLAAGSLIIYEYFPEKNSWFNVSMGFSVVCVTIAGHYGSVLTHGEQYVWEPLMNNKPSRVEVTDSTTMFHAAVFPIIESKCFGCHNPNKLKGQLDMTSLKSLAKGGDHGALWIAGALDRSLLMKRILLPESHKDHMPPLGKTQLNVLEVQLLYQWLLAGGDTTSSWKNFNPADSLRKIADMFIQQHSKQEDHIAKYSFQPASDETIAKLNDPYRSVVPVAANEPGLAATFFLRSQYTSGRLEDLLAVKEQLVELNLSKMPVTDDDCKTITRFSNLEKVNLNFSSITQKGIVELLSLKKLKSLSVAGTALDLAGILEVRKYPALKELFIWNTKLQGDEGEQLTKELPNVIVNTGFVPDEKEILRLTTAIPGTDRTVVDAGELISLSHKLPGTAIRYTVDGTDPDSVTGIVYENPFAINGFTILKTRVCKAGWYCSNIGQFPIFKKGFTPASATLIGKPDKDYKGEGIQTLIDNKKGFVDDHRDKAWMGFRGSPLIAEFVFSEAPAVNNITISYDRNISSFLFPPAHIEVWGGDDDAHLKLISKTTPLQPSKGEPARVDGISIPFDKVHYKTYKIIVQPVAQLPVWHPSNNKKTKDKRAWVFVDEIFFN